MKDCDGVGDTDVSSCNVLLQQQWHGSDTAFSGAKVMAELHQLWNQGHLGGRHNSVLSCLLWLSRDARDLG